ncbi:cysteine desulfurase-like protein [Phycicoccus duodecadis]|uniref:Cysteine desulfurase family protein (TIGR01976 family) n=1 Tax=Phycicoccus duodecadis TaxID=173053 RepID=A0A2N3YIQ1_9MICO|nr:cysteine desulfurase-like protein [Phycicoccus duodecadis]PKW26736.1 cysteine desulfurase family protein (TIGR01976 family) [Phycicoccus duodecadis]
MAFDVERIRSHFPALAEGLAHFDGPGGSQTPDVVGAAVAGTLTAAISNKGVVTASERRASAVVADCRQAMADLLGADPRGIVFGRSATALTYDLSRALAKQWGPGDEVVVTRLDHDSNIRPWVQAAETAGATVRWADFDPATGELTVADIEAVLSERTRLVATTAASNLIGTRPPTRHISDAVHAVGALHWVDGVHATAHASVDLRALGADVWTCSPYKFLGPHCGVLAADPALLETLHPDKLLPSADTVPERFELGTLPYELMAGATAAVDFLAGMEDLDTPVTPAGRRERLETSFAALEAHEESLLSVLEPALRAMPGVTVHSNAAHRTPTLLFTVEGVDGMDVYRGLAEHGVNAPASSFYALECSRHLGLGDGGGVRVGLAPYTNRGDVDRLLAGVADVIGRRG